MNLGLLDILMAQQVEKPDYSRKAENAGRDDISIGQKKFKDHLDVAEKTIVQKNDNNTNEPVTQNLTYKNNQAPKPVDQNNSDTAENFLETAKNINTSNIPAAINQAAKTPAETLQAQQEGLTQVFNLLKGLQDSAGSNNALSALLAPQENGSSDATASKDVLSTLLGLQESAASTVEEAVTTISQSPDNLVQEVSQAIQNAVAELTSGISDKKEATVGSFGKNTHNKDGADDGKYTTAQNTPTITEVAATIINIAKTDAETPQVVETDVKSSQVDSLLKAGKGDKDEEDNSKKAKINVDTNKTEADTKKTSDAANAVVTAVTNKQNNIDNNTKFSNDQLTGNLADGENSIAKDIAAALKPTKDAESPKQGSDLLLQASLRNDAVASSEQNFVKFQKYLDAVGNTQNAMQSDRLTKAEDIIAQIKFGISSMAGKTENTISIQLHPKDLGSVDVRMEINAEGKTKVSIMAEKTDTLNLLQKEAPSLKGMLQDALQTDPSQLNFSFHEKNDEQWKQMINQAFSKGANTENDTADAIVPAIYQQRFTATSGLDIRV